jgi:hypothetical protein
MSNSCWSLLFALPPANSPSTRGIYYNDSILPITFQEGIVTDLTRTQLIATLNNGWGTYVARYRALAPAEQQRWLIGQGYPRFSDLLAHVVAWWVDGQQVVAHVAADPDYPLRDYDVDVFNAEAVAQYAALDEDAMMAAYEQARAAWIPLIEGLSDAAFHNPKIADRLYPEIIGHLGEHTLGD